MNARLFVIFGAGGGSVSFGLVRPEVDRDEEYSCSQTNAEDILRFRLGFSGFGLSGTGDGCFTTGSGVFSRLMGLVTIVGGVGFLFARGFKTTG